MMSVTIASATQSVVTPSVAMLIVIALFVTEGETFV